MTTTVTTPPGPAVAALATRTVTGRILPYGVAGRTSGGALTFGRGSVLVPRDLSRVKLMRDHTGQPGHSPVGYATSIEERDDGLYATFAVARTPDGDAAIADVQGKVRDGFSVELNAIRQDGNNITASHLTAVALVAVPAFADARVSSISASHHGEETMNTDEYTTPETPESGDGTGEPDPARDPERTPDPHPDTEPDTGDKENTDVNTPDKRDPDVAASRPAVTPHYSGGHRSRPALTLSQAAAQVLAIQTGGQVHAELSDITGTGLADASTPAWLGELFTGTAYQRRFAPLATSRPLTSWRVQGYRWAKRPIVDKYAGDKTEIPSGPVSIEPFEATAYRWAGGNDIDRKFYDFNESEILAAYWRALAEDYARKSDQAVADFIVAGANAKSVGTAASVWEGMFALAEALDEKLSVSPTFYIGNPADRRALAATTVQTAPAFLDLLDVDLSAIQWSSKVPKGTMIAGHKSGVTNSELPGSPIRVEAEHIARGGRDVAMFGYQAIYSEVPDALASVKIGSAGQ